MTWTRVLHITTVPLSLAFLRGQLRYMKARGLQVRVISSPGIGLALFALDEGVPTEAVLMPRRISPVADLLAVASLMRQIRRWRPRIVHAHTPKGGLLGMIAAWVARTPVRIYHLRGLPFVTASGFRRRLLKRTEKVSCQLAHRVICVSRSVREVVVAEGLCPSEKIIVLAGGSGNGVDATGRFNPQRLQPGSREQVRQSCGVPLDTTVIGFIGRLVRDKGVIELAAAFRELRSEYPHLRLVMIGPEEERDSVPPEALHSLKSDPHVCLVGENWDTPPLYAAMDVVALPTYREGFPNVPLEAAAMGLPVVATRIPGCIDAVEDGVTGLLAEPRDVVSLVDKIRIYLDDSGLRAKHGAAGRERVLRDFRQEVIWEALYQEYMRLLKAAAERRKRGLLTLFR